MTAFRLSRPTGVSLAGSVTANATLATSSGAPAAGISPTWAVTGDSLMAHDFGCTPIYWHVGLHGGRMQIVANSGFPGRSTQGLRNSVVGGGGGASYLLTTEPGLGGLTAKYGTLGGIINRIGTNDAKGALGSPGIAIDATNQGYIDEIIAAELLIAEHVVWLPTPPVSDTANTRKTNVASWNAYIQSKCDGVRVHWIDDCVDLVDVNGDIVPEYYQADRVHFSNAGAAQMAQTARAAWAALFANQTWPLPLVTDASDKYPAQPQWNPNPTNTGTGGTFGGGWSGTAPTGWRVETFGSGVGGTVAIVAADVGDTNQTAWVEFTPTTTATTGAVQVTYSGDGRALSSGDPAEFEQLMEIRMTGLTCWHELWYWMQGASSQKVTQIAKLKWNAAQSFTDTATLRQKLYRISDGASGPTTHYLQVFVGQNGGASVGKFAVRCLTVRG